MMIAHGQDLAVQFWSLILSVGFTSFALLAVSRKTTRRLPGATVTGGIAIAAGLLFLPAIHLKEYGGIEFEELLQPFNLCFVAPPILAGLWGVIAGRRVERIRRARAQQGAAVRQERRARSRL